MILLIWDSYFASLTANIDTPYEYQQSAFNVVKISEACMHWYIDIDI